MDDRLRTERSRTFGDVADVYDQNRPGYPDPAVRWLAGPASNSVLELGAGTGKLTGSLVAAGNFVVATEPAAPMLAHLVARVSTPALRCSAERLPFRAGSFDVVVVAQAFHWFDPKAALPEIARVLHPGGHLALVWNFRAESVPWVRRLSEIVGSEDLGADLELDALKASRLFGVAAKAQFRFWQQLDRDGLLGLIRSRSYVAALDQAERDELLGRVSALYDEYDNREALRLPYRTECFRAQVLKEPEPAPTAETQRDDGSVLFDFR